MNAASYEYISNVTSGTINNTSTASSYTDYSAISRSVVAGTAFTVTVSIGTPFSSDRVLIWCDWNNNGLFTDAGEAVYSSAIGIGPHTATITAPVGTSVGGHKMRIRLTDTGSGPNATPCGASSYGEVEDYTLTVAAAKSGDTDLADADNSATVNNTMELSIYPNPNNGTFNVKSTQSGTYYLMNEMGQLMQAITLSADNGYTASIDNLAAGVYILSGQNAKGVTKQKIVVTH